MKLDTLIAHNDRVADVVGEFCGTPIYGMVVSEVDFDSARESRRAVLVAQNQTEPSVLTAEVLPGEEISADNVIRRVTTLEAKGDSAYYKQEQTEEGTKRVGLNVARLHSLAGALITWRPDRVVGRDEYALLHEEVAA